MTAGAEGFAPGGNMLLEVWDDAEATKHMNKRILRDACDHKKLLTLVNTHGDDFHTLNACTLLHRLARCLSKQGSAGLEKSRAMQQSDTWRRLLGILRRHAPNCNNMELTNCLWALATLEARGRTEEAVALELMGLCAMHLKTFEPRNLALSAWALAKMGYTDPTWCRTWAAQVSMKLREFDTRDMTMVIWAFATIHWRDEGFLARFCQEVVSKSEDTSPQDIGNTLWALATLSCRNEPALAALSAQCFKKAETFDQQNLSISLWSYATLGYKNMNLLHYMTQLVTERVKSFASQGIANTVWACAKFQFQQKCLLMTVAEDIIPRLDDFEPQHLAIVAWAYATLEFPNRPLLTALCRAASRKMHVFSAQHMANTTWAMATLAHKDEEYLRLMVQRALEQVEAFNPQECSNLAWALALLAFRDDELLAALSVRSQEIVTEFIPQNLGNTAWAYNRLGFRDTGLVRALVGEAARRLHECQGQEVLDLVEAVGTGGYADAVDAADWAALMAWSSQKYKLAREFLDGCSGVSLTFRGLSDFDRALAVQDYRDHLASFDIIGLGYQHTACLLGHLGVVIPQDSELEKWRAHAQVAAAHARHEGDLEKNAEAQEGLKACRTVCVYKFSIRASKVGDALVSEQGPTPIMSGPPTDAYELGLFAATLKHNRAGDGEFRALQACARACLDMGCDPLGEPPGDGAAAEGQVWLYVTEVPCLSCVSAMAQFRKLFPGVTIYITFTLGRQPTSGSRCPDGPDADAQRAASVDAKAVPAAAAAAWQGPLEQTSRGHRNGLPNAQNGDRAARRQLNGPMKDTPQPGQTMTGSRMLAMDDDSIDISRRQSLGEPPASALASQTRPCRSDPVSYPVASTAAISTGEDDVKWRCVQTGPAQITRQQQSFY